MAITISTHNGSSVSLAHNVREPKLIAAGNKRWAERHPGEIRINPNGTFEIWQHQSLAEAYRAFFDEAVQEWNERQIARGRKDRVILRSVRCPRQPVSHLPMVNLSLAPPAGSHRKTQDAPAESAGKRNVLPIQRGA